MKRTRMALLLGLAVLLTCICTGAYAAASFEVYSGSSRVHTSTTLAEAVEYCASGTYTISVSGDNGDITKPAVGNTIRVNGNITLTGDTPSRTITRASSFTGTLLTVSAKASLTIESLTIDGNSRVNSIGEIVEVLANGQLTLGSGAVLTNNVVRTTSVFGSGVNNKGTLNISGGSITDNSSISTATSAVGGAIYTSGAINMSGGTISGNNISGIGLCYGGAIYSTKTGTISLSGGTITDNSIVFDGQANAGKKAEAMGGAIYTGGTLSINGATISNNFVQSATTPRAGGVFISNTGSMTFASGSISNNRLVASIDTFGGGIYNLGSITQSGGTLSGNSAVNGGGVYNAEKYTFTGGSISDNQASKTGGGIINREIFIMSGGTVSNNESDSAAGIYNTSSLSISAGAISGNKAADIGGGICNLSSATATISGATISGNSAGQYGGGIYNNSGLEFNSGTISGNSVSTTGNTYGAGGGVFIDKEGDMIMLGGTLGGTTANTGDMGGGVYAAKGARFITGGSAVVSGNLNSASSAASNIYLAGTNCINLVAAFTDGAAIHVTSLAGRDYSDDPTGTIFVSPLTSYSGFGQSDCDHVTFDSGSADSMRALYDSTANRGRLAAYMSVAGEISPEFNAYQIVELTGSATINADMLDPGATYRKVIIRSDSSTVRALTVNGRLAFFPDRGTLSSFELDKVILTNNGEIHNLDIADDMLDPEGTGAFINCTLPDPDLIVAEYIEVDPAYESLHAEGSFVKQFTSLSAALDDSLGATFQSTNVGLLQDTMIDAPCAVGGGRALDLAGNALSGGSSAELTVRGTIAQSGGVLDTSVSLVMYGSGQIFEPIDPIYNGHSRIAVAGKLLQPTPAILDVANVAAGTELVRAASDSNYFNRDAFKLDGPGYTVLNAGSLYYADTAPEISINWKAGTAPALGYNGLSQPVDSYVDVSATGDIATVLRYYRDSECTVRISYPPFDYGTYYVRAEFDGSHTGTILGGAVSPALEYVIDTSAPATPTPEASATPTAEASATPTAEASATPTAEASATPTAEASATPTAEASATPTAEDTATPDVTPTAEASATPIITPEPSPSATPSKFGYVNDWLNTAALRSSPDSESDANIIKYLPLNTYVDVMAQEGEDWLYVNCENGDEGWIETRLVSLYDAESTPTPAPSALAKVVTEESPLSMRKGPSKDYDVIYKVPKGHYMVTVIYGEEWTYAMYGRFTGFVATEYLKFITLEDDIVELMAKGIPTVEPDAMPTLAPGQTPYPAAAPAHTPTKSPTAPPESEHEHTSAPTDAPTPIPTDVPEEQPSAEPAPEPSAAPTQEPEPEPDPEPDPGNEPAQAPDAGDDESYPTYPPEESSEGEGDVSEADSDYTDGE